MAAIWGDLSTVNSSFTYKWVIHDFCKNSRKVGEAIKSPVFTVTNMDNKYYWQLILYPKGSIEIHKDYCSVGLFTRLTSKPFRGSVTFSLLNNKGNLSCSAYIRNKTFGPGQVKGQPRFFSRNYIARNEDVLDDGKVTILCEISMGERTEEEVEEKKAEEKGDQNMDVDMKVDDCQMLRLREFDDFEHLVDEKAFSDVMFVVNGNTLFAHKCILSTRSQVFAAMFLHDMREKKENKVEVEDIDYDIFREMLRFIYTGKVNRLDKETAYDLLIAADRYSLNNLKNLAEKKLCEEFSVDSALDYLQLADRHRAKILKDEIVEFIIENASAIVNSPLFKILPNDLVIEICGAMANKIK